MFDISMIESVAEFVIGWLLFVLFIGHVYYELKYLTIDLDISPYDLLEDFDITTFAFVLFFIILSVSKGTNTGEGILGSLWPLFVASVVFFIVMISGKLKGSLERDAKKVTRFKKASAKDTFIVILLTLFAFFFNSYAIFTMLTAITDFYLKIAPLRYLGIGIEILLYILFLAFVTLVSSIFVGSIPMAIASLLLFLALLIDLILSFKGRSIVEFLAKEINFGED